MKKNFCILNGVRSDTLEGLMIQELPPVIKPPMRTQIEEIDGRDGSIVTNLGYGAYEKEMIIGLYGDFNLDHIIEFFNSSGIAIFSNELDKIYQYQIMGSIDFERLAHFRVATVTFYVQPFKHSSVEEEQEFTTSPVDVINAGNIESMPVLTITGMGNVTISLNGTAILVVALGSNERTVVIDAEQMNAYHGTAFYNRSVAGDYDDLTLKKGKNTLSWSGGIVSSVKIDNYSRWI